MNRRKFTTKIVFLGIIALVLAVILIYTFQGDALFDNSFSSINLTHHLVWLFVLVCSMLVHFNKDFRKAVRFAALWIGIGASLFIGYSYKDQLLEFGTHLRAELVPQFGKESPDQIDFRAQVGGQFVIEAMVNGFKIKFIFDTGASDVILTPQDANKIGLNPKDLSFDKIYLTANGAVKGAPVRLREIKIGPIKIENVRASVNGSKMKYSLLGMSFLSLIGGYEVIGDKLTLKR